MWMDPVFFEKKAAVCCFLTLPKANIDRNSQQLKMNLHHQSHSRTVCYYKPLHHLPTAVKFPNSVGTLKLRCPKFPPQVGLENDRM